jgi:hypothetical protein
MSRLALGSIALEALACALLAGALGPAPEWIGLAAVLHLAAAIGGAWLLAQAAPARARASALALALGLALAIPALGLAAVLTLRQRLARAAEQATIEAGPSPEAPADPAPASEAEGQGPRGTAVRALLRDRAATTEARSRALLALDRAPVQAAAPLLREALADPGEELRILACLMLERREKLLRATLARAAGELEAAHAHGDLAAQRAALRIAAEQHWERVYQGLVQDDWAGQTLQSAREAARAALAIDGQDAPLWLLLARIELRGGDLEAAEAALRAAHDAGLARAGALPYWAELRFRQSRHGDVASLLRELGPAPAAGPLAAVQRYWSA